MSDIEEIYSSFICIQAHVRSVFSPSWFQKGSHVSVSKVYSVLFLFSLLNIFIKLYYLFLKLSKRNACSTFCSISLNRFQMWHDMIIKNMTESNVLRHPKFSTSFINIPPANRLHIIHLSFQRLSFIMKKHPVYDSKDLSNSENISLSLTCSSTTLVYSKSFITCLITPS